MLSLRILFAALVAVLLVASQSVHAQTSTWYMCAILQGSSYISVNQATLTVSTTTQMMPDYNGVNNTVYTALALVSGTRTYQSLTSNPLPASVTSTMSALAAPGSTGGNDNYFWPGSNPPLDGDGLTFNFTTVPPIAGQSSGAMQMNLWWASGSNSLGEETAGGTHESSPQQSTIQFSQSPITCTVPSYAQFSFCLQIIGPGYTSSDSGLFNTTGQAQPVSSSSGNGLNGQQQGWPITSIRGTRVFTNTSTGLSTTSALTSVATSNSVLGNDNYVFPDSTLIFDNRGLGVSASPAAPIAGGYGAANSLAIAGQTSNGVTCYYEQANFGQSQPTPVSAYLTVSKYSAGTPLPQCSAVAPFYTFNWAVVGVNYTSIINGTISINPLAIIAGNNQVGYTVLAVTGTRTYTDRTPGQTPQVTISTIANLMPTGSTGGNDNILYLNGAQLLDGDGITVNYTSIPPIYGQTGQANQTTTMNMWFNNPTYDEENKGGTHEVNPVSSSFTVTPATNPNAPPACPAFNPTASNNNNAAAASAQSQPLFIAAAVLLSALLSLLL